MAEQLHAATRVVAKEWASNKCMGAQVVSR